MSASNMLHPYMPVPSWLHLHPKQGQQQPLFSQQGCLSWINIAAQVSHGLAGMLQRPVTACAAQQMIRKTHEGPCNFLVNTAAYLCRDRLSERHNTPHHSCAM